MNQPTQPIHPVSPMPYTPPRPPAQRKPRSLFTTGFIAAMGVMTAVTVWAIAWGILWALIITTLAGIGSA